VLIANSFLGLKPTTLTNEIILLPADFRYPKLAVKAISSGKIPDPSRLIIGGRAKDALSLQ
jgi:hypothetical protein